MRMQKILTVCTSSCSSLLIFFRSVCMIVSAMIFAGTNVIFKQAPAHINEIDTLYFRNVISAFVFLPFLITKVPHAPLSHQGIGIFYGVAVGFVGFGLFFVGIKRLPLFQYSALSYSEVPFAMLLGSFLAQRSRSNTN